MGKEESKDVVIWFQVVYPWLDPLGRCYVLGEWSVPVSEGDLGGTPTSPTLITTLRKPKDIRLSGIHNCQKTLSVRLII